MAEAPIMNIEDIARRSGYTVSYTRQLVNKIPNFPKHVTKVGNTKYWDSLEVEEALLRWKYTIGRLNNEVYSPDGRPGKRVKQGAVTVTRKEHEYYISKYGTMGRALRHLINEDQKRIHERKTK